MALTPRTATPYPAATDAPDGPAQMAALALQLEKFSVPKFASSAARDSAIPSPTEGDLCYRTDTKRIEAYSGGAWLTAANLGGPTAYTPTISGTGWALGNGSASGQYEQTGKLVHFWATITFGTTSTFGAAEAVISLPVAANASLNPVLAVRTQMLGGITDNSGAGLIPATPYALVGTTGVRMLFHDKSSGAYSAVVGAVISSTTPMTWTSVDAIYAGGWYWAA